jgi:ribosome biogenesis GTPase
MATHNAQQEGLVVATHGRHCVVETSDGQQRICHPRGKKSQAVVGDRVRWQGAAPGQGEEGTIEKVLERRNLFYRQDEIRTKSFAANIDQVLILIAAEPVFSESQLARALIAAEAAHIQPLIALNKRDLTEPFARAWERLAPYRRMGAPTPMRCWHWAWPRPMPQTALRCSAACRARPLWCWGPRARARAR